MYLRSVVNILIRKVQTAEREAPVAADPGLALCWMHLLVALAKMVQNLEPRA